MTFSNQQARLAWCGEKAAEASAIAGDCVGRPSARGNGSELGVGGGLEQFWGVGGSHGPVRRYPRGLRDDGVWRPGQVLLGGSQRNPVGEGSRQAEGRLRRADKFGGGDTKERPPPLSEAKCQQGWHVLVPGWRQNENREASAVSFP